MGHLWGAFAAVFIGQRTAEGGEGKAEGGDTASQGGGSEEEGGGEGAEGEGAEGEAGEGREGEGGEAAAQGGAAQGAAGGSGVSAGPRLPQWSDSFCLPCRSRTAEGQLASGLCSSCRTAGSVWQWFLGCWRFWL